jgi:hypothetical protein
MQRYNQPFRGNGGFQRPANIGPRFAQVVRGDILWLHQTQTLSSAHALEGTPTKLRPLIVLNQKINPRVDEHGICTDETRILGVPTTSQEGLVAGRPHIACELSHNADKLSYVFLDAVRSVSCKGQRIRVEHKLQPQERQNLTEGLAAILQPEEQFYRRKFHNASQSCMPGEIWRVTMPDEEDPKKICEKNALILLRRGKFVTGVGEDGLPHTTPFLVATLPSAFNPGDIRGLRWNDVGLTPLQQRSFKHRIGTLTPETVGILLNTLRQHAGVTPITYQQPLIRHMFMWLGHLRMLAFRG